MKILAGLKTGADFEHLAQIFFGGARVSGGFKDNEHALLQVAGDVPAGVEDVRDVRLAVFVEGSWYADDGGADFADAAEIGGSGKGAGARHVGHLGRGDVSDITAALVESVNLRGVNIQAQNRHPASGELKRQRQAHITQSDHTDFHA